MGRDSLFYIIGTIGLDGQDIKRMTLAKRGVLMAAVVAKEFDRLLTLDDADFLKEIKLLNSFDFDNLKEIEKELFELLSSDGVLVKKKSLLSCDLNYYTAGIEISEYSASGDIYNRYIEELRAELLEVGEPSLEAVILFTLIRDSGIIHDIFSQKEQVELSSKIVGLADSNKLFNAVLDVRFKNSLQNAFVSLLKGKKNLFKNPYLEGVTLIFPFLERRVSIFIDTIILGTEVKDRREAVIEFLSKMGFEAYSVRLDGQTLLKIDNSYYSLWPLVRTFRFPVQGVVLSPYYI